MLQRIRHSAFLLLLSAASCGGVHHYSIGAKAAEAPPPSEAPAPDAPMSAVNAASVESAPSATSADAAASPAPAPPPVPGAPAQAAAQAPANGAAGETVAQAMLDIEAWFVITVPNVKDALRALHALARARGGFVADEDVQGMNGDRATLTLRVPSGASEAFFEDARKLGEVDSERMNVRDIGKEFHDATILLANLRAALRRYEEILSKAQSVEEILKVEAELTRIRGEIERVEGGLRWRRDRAAQATVHVTLQRKGEVIVEPERAEAKFYPGLRFGYLGDYRGERPGAGYVGGGLSLRGSRNISLDIEGLRGTAHDTRGIDVFQITLGGEDYSDFLGAGKRTYLNPYLGVRAGYARFLGYGEAVAGGTIGLELVHTGYLTLDADLRILGYFFGKPDAHLAAQPALGLNVAF